MGNKPFRRFLKESTQDKPVVDTTTTQPEQTSNTNTNKPLQIIIMGGPASGKGTQCEWIALKYNLIHLSTGDVLRDAVEHNSESGVGAIAKQHMDEGKLVPDDIIIQIVTERLAREDCKDQGWILDGFPRTRVQAEALNSAGFTPDTFLFLNVSDDILIERVSGRRMDPETGKIYHLKFNPPPSDDEEVMNRLVQRSDDTEEKVKQRLVQFHENVTSVRECYEEILLEVDGSKKPEDVKEEIGRLLEERAK